MVRYGSPKVGNKCWLLVGCLRNRLQYPTDPWILRIESRCYQHLVACWLHCHDREAVIVEMFPNNRYEVLPVCPNHKPELKCGLCTPRDRSLRRVRVPCLEGENLNRVPGEDTLLVGKPRLAPFAIDRWSVRAATDFQIG